MNSLQRNFIHHGSQAFTSIKTQQHSVYQTPSPSPDTSSPILIISIVGIITTAFLLLSYYIFVIKCWLNLHRIDVLRQFSRSRTQRNEDPLMAYDPSTENRGVDESVIREIPVFQFKRGGGEREGEERSFYECAVCLNEFQDYEKLRVLPGCTHGFHIDCIDIWLQSNANCPLCRTSISTKPRFPFDHNPIIVPSSSPQDQSPLTETLIDDDEDFVVIEVIGSDADANQTTHRPRERSKSGDFLVKCSNPSPRKLEQRLADKKARKFHQVSSMGDECIDLRGKDDRFLIQPMRRSFSMDSSTDQQLYLAVQEIIQQKRSLNEVSTSEGSSSRVRRAFFPFGHGRGSRNAVLPIQFEP